MSDAASFEPVECRQHAGVELVETAPLAALLQSERFEQIDVIPSIFNSGMGALSAAANPAKPTEKFGVTPSPPTAKK